MDRQLSQWREKTKLCQEVCRQRAAELDRLLQGSNIQDLVRRLSRALKRAGGCKNRLADAEEKMQQEHARNPNPETLKKLQQDVLTKKAQLAATLQLCDSLGPYFHDHSQVGVFFVLRTVSVDSCAILCADPRLVTTGRGGPCASGPYQRLFERLGGPAASAQQLCAALARLILRLRSPLPWQRQKTFPLF